MTLDEEEYLCETISRKDNETKEKTTGLNRSGAMSKVTAVSTCLVYQKKEADIPRAVRYQKETDILCAVLSNDSPFSERSGMTTEVNPQK